MPKHHDLKLIGDGEITPRNTKLLLDGVPLEGVRSVTLSVDAAELNRATIEIYAPISAELRAEVTVVENDRAWVDRLRSVLEPLANYGKKAGRFLNMQPESAIAELVKGDEEVAKITFQDAINAMDAMNSLDQLLAAVEPGRTLPAPPEGVE